jgi:rhamnosyltransferase subunit B
MAGITLVAWAYLGDVTSLVPIGRELARRGHQVRFAVPEGFHDQLRSEPIELVPAGVQFSPRELAVHGDVVGQAMTPAGAMRASRFWAGEFIVKHLSGIHDALMAATAGADLVLTHPAAGLCSRIAAELRGIPWITGHLFPVMLPTASELPLGFPFRRVGRPPHPRYARAAWAAIEHGTGALLHDRAVNAFRASFGLPPVRANLVLGGLSPTDVLVLSSPRYTMERPDWPPQARATGFTVWEGPPDRAMPPSLDAYLDAGDPPVLVTLGTSAASNAEHVLGILAGAIDRLGVRAVFLVGEQAGRLAAMRDRADVWPFAPLPAVLRRCGAVVHAGGHGTTAAVVTAGLPSVVLPQIIDQRWHGERLEALGAGRLVVRWDRHPGAVEDALRAVLTDPAYATGAAALGAAVADEDGPGAAADAIEARLADPRPDPGPQGRGLR